MKNITEFIKNNDIETVLQKAKQDYCGNMISILERQFNRFTLNEDNLLTGLKLINWIVHNNNSHKGQWHDTCSRLLNKTDLVKDKNKLYLEICSTFNVDKDYPLFASKLSSWSEGWEIFTNKVFNQLTPKLQNKYLKYSMISLEDKTILSPYFERIDTVLKSEGLGWIPQLMTLDDNQMLNSFKFFYERNYPINTAHILKFANQTHQNTTYYLISKCSRQELTILNKELERSKYFQISPFLSTIILNVELEQSMVENKEQKKKLKI